MRPIRKPVARKYFGVTLDFRVIQFTPTYNAETDTVEDMQRESDIRRFQVRALGQDEEEAFDTARLALQRSIENANQRQTKAGDLEVLIEPVDIIDITELDLSKPERTLSFV